jgi:hypothetical protein
MMSVDASGIPISATSCSVTASSSAARLGKW